MKEPNTPYSKTLSNMHIVHKAYLGAFLRTQPLTKHFLIDLDSDALQPLAPTEAYRTVIIRSLFDNNLIEPAQKLQNDDSHLYALCIAGTGEKKKEILMELMYPQADSQTAADKTILHHLLTHIQYHEAIEYMRYTLEAFHLSTFDADERFKIFFTRILEDYSLAELFNTIYHSIKELAVHTMKNPDASVQVSHFIYKGISDRYEKAKFNNLALDSFHRPAKLPQTELSKIVSNDMLCLGDSAFYRCSSKNFSEGR